MNECENVGPDLRKLGDEVEYSPFYLCSFLESSGDGLSESPGSKLSLNPSICDALDAWTVSLAQRITSAPRYRASLDVAKRNSGRTITEAHDRTKPAAASEQSVGGAVVIEHSKVTVSPFSKHACSGGIIENNSYSSTVRAGYVGQFRLTSSDIFRRFQTTLVFGDWQHPNGELHYSRFISDSLCQRTRPTDYRLQMNALFRNAESKSQYASSQIGSEADECLRKERHHECAAAQLEGVPVGHWRYYQGHLTVEEYIQVGLCVCWGDCFCNKLCSQFGDLVCPCNRYLRLVA